ncbi:hypothetical protein So717_07700 [Roseobacter cerasinus]|uniref:Uncharacterized protein n=1 Tax=Roseobacter cerasinus TaxID=2602289 RepID=A0A640VMR7_9RHOB|nr:hypothetical protein [Roseobacter cerasinus]GFE49017.1 hypothetical protein So717_07700 [Roseobacter cerasinus]
MTPADAQDYKQHATISDAIFRKTDDYNQAGLKGGSVENIHKTSALATKDARNSPEQEAVRKSKRQYDDTLFLALLQRGDLDNFVAEKTFSGMSDAEINDVVAQIEAESGQSFEDYAKDILGENMPERRPGESDADYNRRVLTAVAEEVLNDDLTFKPGYENDPIARIIRRSEVYKEAQGYVGGNSTGKSRGWLCCCRNGRSWRQPKLSCTTGRDTRNHPGPSERSSRKILRP